MQGAPKGFAAGLDTFITLEAQAKDGKMDLALQISSQLIMAKKHRPFLFPDDGYAAPRLETDGRRWEEARRTHPSVGRARDTGRLMFFSRVAGGVRARNGHSVGDSDPRSSDVLATESRRGTRGVQKAAAGTVAPAANSSAKQPSVRLNLRFERWSEEQGQRVAHFTMTGQASTDVKTDPTQGASPSLAMRVKADARWRS